LFAGHDTTTSALSFIFYNIAKYPEVQQKIYEEIISIFENNEEVTLSKLNDLQYTEAVIKESLRLFPPVPYYGRKFKNEFTADGLTFPKDTNILVSPYLMGRSEKYFKNPEVFDPDRFNLESSYEKKNPFAYLPFSAGIL
jgi:cytochrome P450 family 4